MSTWPLRPELCKYVREQRSSQNRLVRAASSDFTRLLITHTYTGADSVLGRENHGRKSPVSLGLSKIFIHSTVASKHNRCNLDEILIIRDFNYLIYCGWRGKTRKKGGSKGSSKYSCHFPSALKSNQYSGRRAQGSTFKVGRAT